MDKVKDLRELASLSEGKLESILGNDANAKLLWSFLHSEVKPAAPNGGRTSSKQRTRSTKT